MAKGLNVVRLQPPPLAPVTFADARALWDRAEIRACLDALRADDSPQGAILASRCCLRLDRPIDALERLSAASAAILDSGDLVRGENAVVTATAHFFLGNADIVDTTLCDSRAYIYSTRNRDLELELNLLEGRVAWSRHELNRARAIAEHSLHTAHSGKWRARAFELFGAIAGAEGNYKKQIDFYERAWAALDEAGERDPWARGGFLQVLAILCNDLYRRNLVQAISEREQAIQWTADTEYMRFAVLRHVARCYALAGDHLRAFRLLRQAAEIAPSLPWRVMIFAERSSLACEMNERLFASEELEQAQSMAARYDWSKTRGDERYALLRLAQVTALGDPPGAQALLEIYRKKVPSIAPNMLTANDGRLGAMEAYSYGIVALYSGEATRAVERLTHAFSVWRGIDYVWRALDVAIHLARLTGQGVFTEYARRHARAFPNTWLARQAEQLQTTSLATTT